MKVFSGCQKKAEARLRTIVEPYRRHIGHSLPKDRQYWTMCASHVDKLGRVFPGCELRHMQSVGLITSPNQFHGVDIQPGIIAQNRKHMPEVNWHVGDFYEQMAESLSNGVFNPAVVNYDSFNFPSTGCPYLTRVMSLLEPFESVVMACNLILKNRHKSTTAHDAWKLLLDRPQFRAVFSSGWNFDYRVYVYNGTGVSGTKMGSLVFWR